MTPTVLHVTDCYSTGVARAIRTAVRLTPEIEHHLVWAGEEDPRGDPFASVAVLPSGHLARVRAVRLAAARTRCDVVHAHSSRAGVYVRAAGIPGRVVYQPHAYKLLDPGLSSPARHAVALVERLLGGRTDHVIVLSAEEDEMARRLSPGARRTLLPNLPSLAVAGAVPPVVTARGRSVVMSGRTTMQKDPRYLVAVAEELRGLDPSVQVRWIGSRDDDVLAAELEAAGVVITGWCSPGELADELARAGVYLHSARYEGFPLSVLDAAWCAAPVLVRDIPAFVGTGLVTVADPADAARRVLQVLDDKAARERVLAVGHRLLTRMSADVQRQRLLEVYE